MKGSNVDALYCTVQSLIQDRSFTSYYIECWDTPLRIDWYVQHNQSWSFVQYAVLLTKKKKGPGLILQLYSAVLLCTPSIERMRVPV